MVDGQWIWCVHGARAAQWYLWPRRASAYLHGYGTTWHWHLIEWHIDYVLTRLGGYKWYGESNEFISNQLFREINNITKMYVMFIYVYMSGCNGRKDQPERIDIKIVIELYNIDSFYRCEICLLCISLRMDLCWNVMAFGCYRYL